MVYMDVVFRHGGRGYIKTMLWDVLHTQFVMKKCVLVGR